ncbi:MAG: DUF4426 domain-containing protein [Pseudomonadota bacterium]|nr:MAG: DUF4426 domain-containing protein [Pseudomonadota bacterium]
MRHVHVRMSLIATAALLLAMLGGPAFAQQSEEFGDWVVHYNAINTNLLPPEVARAYGIQRSGSRALLNIAVLEKHPDALDEPIHASVTASAINLTGQRRDIALREIEDQGAIYYIGTFRIHDEETLTFSIQVKPGRSEQPAREITFRQQFFTG